MPVLSGGRWTAKEIAMDGVGRQRFRVLALDIDGTLAGADGRVSRRAVAALARSEQAGLRVVLVTGRAVPTPLAIWQAAGLSAPLITCGGALTVQPPGPEILDLRPLPEQVAIDALALGARLGLVVSLWTPTEIWVTARGPIGDLLSAINGLEVLELPRAPDAVLPGPFLKAMFGGEPQLVDRVQADIVAGLFGVMVSRSMREFVEATAADASKERALSAVLARIGVDPAQVIAAGDADNDLGMLRLAGYAIAPGDAMPGPRAEADLVVGPHDADGIAEFIEAFLDDQVHLRT
jgi:Cof subfamily protein (haloacid dehalogenase superfamily)